MGWQNPPVSWAEYERLLSGRGRRSEGGTYGGRVHPPGRDDPDVPADADGGDSPAWSRRRAKYEVRPQGPRAGGVVPYAELHCHSNFSFLDGASHPEELVEEAVRLGLSALALTDHDGMYGVVRFAEAAKGRLPTVYGAELSLGLTKPQNGEPDPEGSHLLALARGPEGYHRLCRVLTRGHLDGGEKGRPVYDLEQVAAEGRGHWTVLTGCRKGAVRRALEHGGTEGMDAAAAELDRLVALFGRDSVAVELTHQGDPLDDERNDALAALADRFTLPVVATNNVHYAAPSRYRLATALAAVRARRSLEEMDGWLLPSPAAHLRSGEEMAARFARYPTAVPAAARIGAECAFDLQLVAPELPPCEVPDNHDEMSWLRRQAHLGARNRYADVKPESAAEAYEQINHELNIIDQLGFPGYFLIVWDIVEFCRRNGILCQGRGSAANSAVCYALGITAVDPIHHKLLFERFLAPERDGPPDIDLDIESDRREEVIQYVYDTRYDRLRAAQVANVITYRPRSAVRDMARALGYSTGQQDAWSKQIDRWGPLSSTVADGDSDTDNDIPADVAALADQLQGFPRHLGIHSGGMVLCARPVSEVVPVEHARMTARTVIQWDKDDCAAIHLVKFDLLGLGMLSALHYAFDLIAEHHGRELTLQNIPEEDTEVYEMLCKADSIGVFQVESRAQMATLPRLRPENFYDLAIEVALIRPGPIQGGSVHPYIRRRKGIEPKDPIHPLVTGVLERTNGVPLFQEQLMQMAISLAGFDASQADELRRAVGSKRSEERMAKLRPLLYAGMAERGITGEKADEIFDKLAAFANFGFPESHALSFARLVYISAWLKRHYPAAFCAALLNAQPMGFYTPQSLVADARRHGVRARGPDVLASHAAATLEPDECSAGGKAVRLGLSSVRHLGAEIAERVAAERAGHGRYAGIADLTQRVGLTVAQTEALATAGAFGCFGVTRREALWAAGAAAEARPDRLPGTVVATDAPALPGMTEVEEAVADVWATGITPDTYPTQFLRDRLDDLGVVSAGRLVEVDDGSQVLVGGAVTHRQRPATARGTTFINLEDETGFVNIICSPGVWARYRRVARASPALLIRGRVEKADGVINVIAERIGELELSVRSKSRDFR